MFRYQVPLLVVFQSTHSRGVRRNKNVRIDFFSLISIHALTRSATLMQDTKGDIMGFQSTHSRGVRRSPLPDLVFAT